MIGPLVLLVFLAASSASGEGPLSPRSLSGRVVDPDGLPVVGTRIASPGYDPAGKAVRAEMEGRTDGAGRFRISPIAPSTSHRKDFTVHAFGFARETNPGGLAAVYSGRDQDVVAMRLDRGRVRTRFGLNERGQPRTEAEVSEHGWNAIEVKQRPPDATGFELLRRWWVVDEHIPQPDHRRSRPLRGHLRRELRGHPGRGHGRFVHHPGRPTCRRP